MRLGVFVPTFRSVAKGAGKKQGLFAENEGAFPNREKLSVVGFKNKSNRGLRVGRGGVLSERVPGGTEYLSPHFQGWGRDY